MIKRSMVMRHGIQGPEDKGEEAPSLGFVSSQKGCPSTARARREREMLYPVFAEFEDEADDVFDETHWNIRLPRI